MTEPLQLQEGKILGEDSVGGICDMSPKPTHSLATLLRVRPADQAAGSITAPSCAPGADRPSLALSRVCKIRELRQKKPPSRDDLAQDHGYY